MTLNKLIIIIIIAIIICIGMIYKYNKPVEGMYTFNGRMAENTQWFYDKLFDDVYYFPNRYEKPYESGEEIGRLIETGYDHCCRECSGSCLEYGVNGEAYCFINRLYSI